MCRCSSCNQNLSWKSMCNCYTDCDFISFLREQAEEKRALRVTHKSFTAFVGQDLYLPLCNTSAIWNSNIIVKRNWKDVTCPECLKHKPKKKGE